MGHPIGTDYTVLTLQLGCEADPQKISSPKEQGGRRPCRSRFQSVLSPSNYTVLSVKLCYVGVGHVRRLPCRVLKTTGAREQQKWQKWQNDGLLPAAVLLDQRDADNPNPQHPPLFPLLTLGPWGGSHSGHNPCRKFELR